MARKQTWVGLIREDVAAVKSGRTDLRKFGITMTVALSVLGGLFLWRAKGAYPYLFASAAAFLALGLAAPLLLKPIQRAWMTLAAVMGWVMTRVVLAIVFYLGVTPIALIARLVGKRFLDLTLEPQRESYWERKARPTRGKERYESQF